MLIESFLIGKLTNKPNKPNNLGPGGQQQHPDDNTGSHPTQYPHPTGKGGTTSQKKIVLAILNIILAFIAGYLAWNCNAGEKSWLRVIYTILASVFSGLYMIYYLIYRVIIRASCGKSSGTSSGKTGSSSGSSSGSSGYGNSGY